MSTSWAHCAELGNLASVKFFIDKPGLDASDNLASVTLPSVQPPRTLYATCLAPPRPLRRRRFHLILDSRAGNSVSLLLCNLIGTWQSATPDHHICVTDTNATILRPEWSTDNTLSDSQVKTVSILTVLVVRRSIVTASKAMEPRGTKSAWKG